MSLVESALIIAGLWSVINGILHDVFVLRSEHGKKYDRDLLRLLMDGHILITCGAIQLCAYWGIAKNEIWAYYTALIATASLLIYCAMIWKFLKSLVTILINTSLLFLLLQATMFK